MDLEEARAVIEEYPSEDSYIMGNIQYFMNGGDPDDNSIQLSKYYQECLEEMKKPKRKRLEKELDDVVRSIVKARTPRCVCCGSVKNLQPGHLITRSKKSIRWDLDNVWTQCSGCNFKHEHFPEIYTNWWIERHGFEAYGKLIAKGNEIRKWTIPELEEELNHLKKILNTYTV